AARGRWRPVGERSPLCRLWVLVGTALGSRSCSRRRFPSAREHPPSGPRVGENARTCPGPAQPVPSAAGAAPPGVHRPSGPRGAGGGGGGGGGSSGQDGRPRVGPARRPRRGGSTGRIWVGAP